MFTTSREKLLWFWTLLVIVMIFSTLFVGQPLEKQLRDQNTQAVFFVLGMVLIGVAILFHGIKVKLGMIELAILIGVIAIFVLFFFRLGAPERSHLIEYSVLAIFTHSAIMERLGMTNRKLKPAILAFMFTCLIGLIDESIQVILPHRVFDLQDILFNGMVALIAIGTSLVLVWIRKRITGSK